MPTVSVHTSVSSRRARVIVSTFEKESKMKRSLNRIRSVVGIFTAFAMTFAFTTNVQADLIPIAANLDSSLSGTTPSSLAIGAAAVIYDTDTKEVFWDINITEDTLLDGVGSIINAHFHGPAIPGENASVRLSIRDFSLMGTDSPLVGMAPINAGTGDPADIPIFESELLGGLWYINIHTTRHTGGEIRGFNAVVPEPSSLALAAIAGVGMVGCGWRRRKS